MCRFYGMIRVDLAHKGTFEDIQNLNEKLEDVLQEWSEEMMNKGVSTDIGWNWSEHKNVQSKVDNMKDFEITIKQLDGAEMTFSTEHIDEDVLRIRCGLDVKEQD